MLTWANIFTSLRVFIAPAFFYFIITGNPLHTRIALLLFCVAALTDFFDGYVARKLGEVTELGNFLDPLADKILVLSAFFAFVFLGIVPLWLVLVIILRDAATTTIRVVADNKGVPLLTSRTAKWKTALQMFYVVMVLVLIALSRTPENPNMMEWGRGVLESWIVYWGLIGLAVFTVFTFAEYLMVNRTLFRSAARQRVEKE